MQYRETAINWYTMVLGNLLLKNKEIFLSSPWKSYTSEVKTIL